MTTYFFPFYWEWADVARWARKRRLKIIKAHEGRNGIKSVIMWRLL